jgi:chorismate lyase / 3-hydroxybenzoate synthase
MGELKRKLNCEPANDRAPLRCSLTPRRAGEHLLTTVGFGAGCPAAICVDLQPLLGQRPIEYWLSTAPIEVRQQGMVLSHADGQRLVGVIEIEESEHGGIAGASEAAYREIMRFQEHNSYPHILRMWNYFAAINEGPGDDERYKLFCAGRAAALRDMRAQVLPAASAIGTRMSQRMLQVYWISSRVPGRALENPRQTSAYRYPREYGPAAPSFSRAMLSGGGTLFISGTASIVGHASRHEGDLHAQLSETLQNLDTLTTRAHDMDPRVPARLGSNSVAKLYVRHEEHAPAVMGRLQAHYGSSLPIIVLAGDICRRELLIEIECVHAADAATLA